ncbi:MAG: protein kinase, partial [Nocardioides sp.]|nr:protein kinase [Nocardioides sp.]
LLVIALLLAASAGVGAWWFGYGRYTSTPSVIGMGRAAAETKIEAEGLEVQLGQRTYSETVPAGRVIDTDPGAGERVLDGGTVTVVLSLGKERYDVPKVKGLTEDQAQDALTATHLSFGTSVPRFSETVPEGTVIGSDPKVGTTLRPGAAVDLVVSRGPKPITVRDFTGRDADLAQQKLEGRGLVVDRGTEEFSDTVPEGAVISQSPSSGTLFRGDTVTLVVSRGPELVKMPYVLASGVEAARAQLEALGFVVDVENASGYLGLGYVFSTDPDAGEMVPRGSRVTLFQI